MIHFVNESVSEITGVNLQKEAVASSYSFSEEGDTTGLFEPTFKIKLMHFTNSTEDNSTVISCGTNEEFIYTSMYKILKNPYFLGESRQNLIKLSSKKQNKDDETKDRILLFKSSEIIFNGKNCMLLTIRDLTELAAVEKIVD